MAKFPYLTRRTGSANWYYKREVPPELHADGRFRRSARRGDFAKMLAFVEANASSFTDDTRDGVVRLARLEAELRSRNMWSD